MTLEQANNEYIESIKTKVRDYYQYERGELGVIVRKSNVDHTYGVYIAYESENYELVCTDETIDVYIALMDSSFTDKYREAMWTMLADEAATHGLRQTIPDLSNVLNEDLIDELKRRGQLS